MGFKSFVALVAGLMAMNAIGIDTMLPALPQIAAALRSTGTNQAQTIITAYLLGLGAGQLVYGVLSDRFGRRPVLMVGIGIFTLFSLVCAFATTFEMIIAARLVQGIGAAAARVLAVSIVRDRYAGRQMARVMSLVSIVFMSTPILAPSIGQAIIHVAPWPWLFHALAIFGAVLMAAVWFKLPESLHPEDRLPLSARRIFEAFRSVLTTRMSLGYMLALTMMTGSIFGFVNSAQQVFTQTFRLGVFFPVVFAGLGLFMAASSLINSQIVERLGSRRVSHGALLVLITMSGIHAVVALTGHDTIWSFFALQGATMLCFGMVAPNFNAMAMSPMGHIAGTASSVQGFVSTLGAAILGFVIGQAYDGTSAPVTLGFFVMGLTALAIVFITERGRLFTPRER